ncbi:ABC transporter substrate-binding protein [Pseudomonas vanderleydeniana]|uniref:ABC transporter substrate-binding protein n=1 Tax=Pseudomonas vanderleydeniana TaxID=2745495 RepID=A0A9E6PGL7_9PSED|nr:ABC transporter substrate-binding protein [Pseudomonas vanderleydeniana]QXI25855.1 ABC transporter substrate-binding protein [Pseudomonas vanderleydeniana]
MSAGLKRRAFLQGLAAVVPAWHVAGAWAEARAYSRVVPLSWELAETFLALGQVPIALPLPDWYRRTIVEPPLPEGVIDVGLLYQPSFTLLQQLRPDLLILTPGHVGLKSMLERLAPTATFGGYMSAAQPYPALQQETRQMAALLACAARGEALVNDTEQLLNTVRQRLASQPDLLARPVLVADAVDEHHLRVYGAGSLFDTVLSRIGVSNAAHPGDAAAARWVSNSAGYALVPLQRIAALPEVSLLLVGPLPPGVDTALRRSPVWQALPCVRERRVALMPVIAPYGGLVSLQRFARAVEAALYPMAHQEPASV